MPRLLPSRRGTSGLRLKVRSTDEPDVAGGHLPPADDPRLPWPLASLLAGVGGALGGWLIVAGLVVLAWLAARDGGLAAALATATQGWLLANGGGLVIAGQRLTLVPLGATALFALLLSGLVQVAARQATVGELVAGIDLTTRDRGRIVRNVTLVATLGYAASVTLAATMIGTTNQGARALVGSLIIGALASLAGACRGAAYRLRDALPAWATPLPGALRAGLATAIAGGAAALAVTVAVHRGQVAALYAALAPDSASQGAVTVVQLLFWPTLVVWATAYALGAGFGLGEGSVVSPANTDLGLIPGIPVLGALPVEGSGSWATLAWMLVGVAAGAAAAAVVMRGRPRARFDETAVVGGLAGVLVALCLVAIAAATRGDLGGGRLVGLGPRLPELALLGGSVMGLAGLTTGLVWGLVRGTDRRPEPPGAATDGPPAAEDAGDVTVGEPEPSEHPAVIGDPSDEPTRRVGPDDDEPTQEIGPRSRWWHRR
ncbi:cell division protein PerM [Mariniluteicoccus flavus]